MSSSVWAPAHTWCTHTDTCKQFKRKRSYPFAQQGTSAARDSQRLSVEAAMKATVCWADSWYSGNITSQSLFREGGPFLYLAGRLLHMLCTALLGHTPSSGDKSSAAIAADVTWGHTFAHGPHLKTSPEIKMLNTEQRLSYNGQCDMSWNPEITAVSATGPPSVSSLKQFPEPQNK